MNKNRSTDEMEIKLDLVNESNFARLLDYLPEPIEIREQTNYFFDTADWDLSRTGWALRLRSAGETAQITAKGMAARDMNGLTVRPEIELPMTPGQLEKAITEGINSNNLPGPIIAAFGNIVISGILQNRLSFMTTRFIIECDTGKLEFRYELDRTVYSDSSMDYELEIEIDDRSRFESILEIIEEVLSRLGIPLKFQRHSKLARALKKNGIDIGFDE